MPQTASEVVYVRVWAGHTFAFVDVVNVRRVAVLGGQIVQLLLQDKRSQSIKSKG